MEDEKSGKVTAAGLKTEKGTDSVPFLKVIPNTSGANFYM
jgi:hypothetical protein